MLAIGLTSRSLQGVAARGDRDTLSNAAARR